MMHGQENVKLCYLRVDGLLHHTEGASQRVSNNIVSCDVPFLHNLYLILKIFKEQRC